MGTDVLQPQVDLVLSCWRLARLVEAAIAQTPPQARTRIDSRLRFVESEVRRATEQLNLQLVEFTGQAYSTGLPLTVVNLEDIGSDEDLLISETVEPAVLRAGQVLVMGRAAVARRGGH